MGPENPQSIIQFLNQIVTWYRQMALEREIVSAPSDVVFLDDNARISGQIVRLAFDFARGQAQLMEKEKTGSPEQQQGASRYEGLIEASRKLDTLVQQTQQEIDSLRRQLDSATGRKRQDLQSTLAELQSELQLFQARRDVVHTMVDFADSTTGGLGASGLTSQIEALSHSVPAALSAPAVSSTRPEANDSVSTPVTASKPEPSGLWGLIANIVSASRRMRILDQRIQLTNALEQECTELQAPATAQLRQLAEQGDAIATQADSDSRAVLKKDKGDLDTLTAQFKAASSSFVPLSKLSILLDVYSRNLANWRSAVKTLYTADLKNLAIRLLSLVLVLALVWGVAEIWRRTIFRYVHETRRRYQMLLLRRIALWLAVTVVIVFAFASELGSVATFAGLITAGVAVALQNVILSIAGYFFLIGKFGVRVGDRVQIADVTGEVVDIGLVRIHVMEMRDNGRDLQPTGRVVAFSNSFVFQPTAGMFKQIPGTNFVWHEITLTLAADSPYRSVEERMTRAVDTAFAAYHENLERQRVLMEANLGSVSVGPLRPRTALRLTLSGLEVKISFPVEVQHATEIDDRVTREILKELDREPKLKMVGSDIPTIRQITDLSASASTKAS